MLVMFFLLMRKIMRDKERLYSKNSISSKSGIMSKSLMYKRNLKDYVLKHWDISLRISDESVCALTFLMYIEHF